MCTRSANPTHRKSQGRGGSWSSPCSPRPSRRGGSFGVDATRCEAVLGRLRSWGPSTKGPAVSNAVFILLGKKEWPGSKTKHCSLGTFPGVLPWSVPGNAPDETLPCVVLPDLCRLSCCWNDFQCSPRAIADTHFERLNHKKKKILSWGSGAPRVSNIPFRPHGVRAREHLLVQFCLEVQM